MNARLEQKTLQDKRIGMISPDKWDVAGEELCRSTGLSCLGAAWRAKTEVPMKCTVISGLKSRAPITININCIV